MTQQITQIPRPQADRFADKKKLFLVPNYVGGPELPEQGLELVERYWSEARDSIASLERSLGAVSKVYHEMICADGEDGLVEVDAVNPNAAPLIRAMCRSTASMRALEDMELIEELTDWQRILTLPPVSRKVMTLAIASYEETLATRFERIAARLSDDLAEGESAALFIREDHRAQFGSDIQVFYVAPPSLDALRRWLNDYFRFQPAAAPEDESD